MRVILHIGLPKTATTTFQKKVFYPLHEKGLINYLGKKPSSNKSDLFFPVKNVVSSILKDDELLFEKNISSNEAILREILCEDKINVLSEEQLTLTAKYDPDVVYGRIKRLFQNCDVEIILFIRNQVDMIYSYYVEMYKHFYFKDKKRNAINKFYKCVVSEEGVDYYQFNYLWLVGVVSSYLGKDNVNVFMYEDISLCKNLLSEKVSKFLRVESSYVLKSLEGNRENYKRISDGKYINDDISMLGYWRPFVNYVKKNSFVNELQIKFLDKDFFYLKNVYSFIVKNVIGKIKVMSGTVHEPLSEEQKKCIKERYLKDNMRLCALNGLSDEKMKEYGYI